MVRKTQEQRFLSKFNVTNGCWNWIAGKNEKGYGTFAKGRTMVYAHRFSYEFHIGAIPVGLMVCHTCDNPSCVNPGHLFLGTHGMNMADRSTKLRTAKGRKIPTAKLDEAKVRAIRFDSRPARAIAADYNVSHTQIIKTKKGLIWSHIL